MLFLAAMETDCTHEKTNWYVLNVYSKCLITVVIAASVVDWASVLEHTIQGARWKAMRHRQLHVNVLFALLTL